MLAAVILAAGESRRMGEPKALVDFRGRTFLQRLLEATRHPRVGVTRVVLGALAEEIRAALSLDPAIVVQNSEWRQGQLSSIQAAIRSLQPGSTATPVCMPGVSQSKTAQAGVPVLPKPSANLSSVSAEAEGILLCPVDHPLISANVVAALIEQFDSSGKAIVLPTFHGRRGHPVLFRCNLFSELLAAPPDIGARAVVWAHPAEVLEVLIKDEAIVLNLNDPEALRLARERADLT